MRKIVSFIGNNLLITSVLLFSLLTAVVLSLVANKPIFINVPFLTSPSFLQATTFTYKGEIGKNALILLKEKTAITQDATAGQVTAINGRKADNKKHEYWAFYVNGKLSSVGPKEYQTKNGDMMMWKIEKY